ncbi:MAG: TIM barrel protein [Thermodesulfovibrionia bacterium]|nr:TIM barrel protein [Thermodesulfovibrionia bacterium]
MAFHFKVGLKLYSTNVELIPEASRLMKEGLYDYVELYVIPGSYMQTINNWETLDISFVIHTPHSFHDVNFAQADKWQTNQRNFIEVQKFADSLSAGIIIVHGGNNGSFDETLKQLARLDEKRIALENKPCMGINGEICVGGTPEEFQKAFDSGVIKQTVLDFGHAVCAANFLQMAPLDLIKKFAGFNPKVFHLSDGDALSEKDTHYNLGKGSMNIAGFLSTVPEGGLLTIETPRRETEGLKDFMEDVVYLNKLIN